MISLTAAGVGADAPAGAEAPSAGRRYWRDKLAGHPRPAGPRADHRRPDHRVERTAAMALAIDGDLLAKLTQLTGGEPFLEHAALAAALTACLHRYSQASPVVLGSPAIRSEEAPDDPANAVPLVTEVDGQASFRQLLLRVRQTLLEGLEHQRIPFAQMLSDLGLPAAANRCPLFDVALIHRGLHASLPEVGNDITLTFERAPGCLRGTAAWSPRLYDAATVERLGHHLLRLLRTGLEDPNTPLADLDMLGDQERRRLLIEWNDTARDYPRDVCVHQLFEAHVAAAPERIALVDGDLRLSYGEVDRRANQLAHHLQALGVGPNTPVGICLNRSPALVIAVLAVLKAGGAYVPFDPTYPRERVAVMFEDVKLKVLLTRQELLDRLPERKPRVVCVDRDAPAIAQRPSGLPPRLAGPGDLCYVIFTSGSTGRPKAAAVYHRGWTNLLCWFGREFAISPSDKNLVMSSISFDITQRSMAMPLTRSGELHLVPDGYDPELLLRTLRDSEITLLNCAPSTFYPLVEGPEAGRYTSLRSLRCLFLGGEAISASRLMGWAASPGRTTGIANVYGAAECSDVSSFYRLHDFERYSRTSVPIGTPTDNSKVYLLDEGLRLVPIGVGGEICLAGDGVGRGYVNDAALTTRKFVDDPFAAEPGARLYRTGDLARYLPDGNLEFLGRIDHQVKIRGQRIELGEIETQLRAHPRIKEAVAVAAESTPGEMRLTAYYVAVHAGDATDPTAPSNAGDTAAAQAADPGLEDELRAALAQKLPAYMVPNLFIALREMPLNPNGKIDRDALPAPSAAVRRAGSAAPAVALSAAESTVARLFADLLKVEEVSRDDNFFRLGGHSLMATQMIANISEAFNVRFPAIDFFARPTVAGIAARVEAIAATTALAAATAPPADGAASTRG